MRLALISGHYARPFNLTRKTLADAAKNRQRYLDAADAAAAALVADRPGGDALAEPLGAAWADTLAAMADDLNTPQALAAAYRGAGEVLTADRSAPLSAASAQTARQFLDRVDGLLGIVGQGAEAEDARRRPA